jgi:hypothetical protein
MKLTRAVFELSKAELVALVAHAGTDKTRPNQRLLVLDPKMGRIHATDGHRLALVITENPSLLCPDAVSTLDAPRSLVPRDVAERLSKTRGCASVRFAHGAGQAQVFDRHNTLIAEAAYADCAAELEEAKTPPPGIEPLLALDVPHTEPAALTFGINPSYLADLALVQWAIPGTPSGTFRAPDDELSPLFWRFGAWRVLIMPVRLDADTESQRKAWARTIKASEAAKAKRAA